MLNKKPNICLFVSLWNFFTSIGKWSALKFKLMRPWHSRIRCQDYLLYNTNLQSHLNWSQKIMLSLTCIKTYANIQIIELFKNLFKRNSPWHLLFLLSSSVIWNFSNLKTVWFEENLPSFYLRIRGLHLQITDNF